MLSVPCSALSQLQYNVDVVLFKKGMLNVLSGGHAYVQCCTGFLDSVRNMRISTRKQFTYMHVDELLPGADSKTP
jgi:hypothetical protein